MWAFILREARLINGTLTNSEVWPSLNQQNFESLEAADLDLMRKIFNAHSRTASEFFFLESGKIPLRFVIYKRRLMYLWHILSRNESELIHKVYTVQKFQTTRGDWYELAQRTKAILSIDETDAEIKEMKQKTFKSYVRKISKWQLLNIFRILLRNILTQNSSGIKEHWKLKNISMITNSPSKKFNCYFHWDQRW